MGKVVTLDNVLDAAELLDDESYAELARIVSSRVAERGRERVVATVEEGLREFAAGHCKPATPAEIVREATR